MKYIPPPCFKRVYWNLILLNRIHKNLELCLQLQCQIYMSRDGSTWPLPPKAQWKSSGNMHGSQETCSLNPISHRSTGQASTQNPRILGSLLLKYWGFGYQTVLFRSALWPWRSPAQVLEDSPCPAYTCSVFSLFFLLSTECKESNTTIRRVNFLLCPSSFL